MYLFGTALILAAIMAALIAVGSYALVPFGRVGALRVGRISTRMTGIAVVAVVVFLNYIFVAQRYDIDYVYNYSSSELEPHFRVAAVWAGQPGSFVIWALWGVLAAQVLVRRTRNNEPYVLSIFMSIQAALLIFMLIRNPFVPHLENGIPTFPTDGKGLNATLHNMWMLIHPPILFVGFALMAVPFAFALGGLWRRDYDGWVRDALPWTLAAWAFLGLALLLGGYWAYETLNWGGYWGWDPVENSALVPWFTALALIHAMLVQRASGGLRRTTIALALMTYVLVFYATFLTRSGVLSSFSVHSFVEEGLKTVMISYLSILAFGSLLFFAWRWRDMPAKPLSTKLLSRDSFVVLMIVSILVIGGVIALGTSMPIISAIPGLGAWLQSTLGGAFQLDDGTTYGGTGATPFQDGRFGLVGNFYSTTVPPLGLITIALMIVGPLLGWHDTNVRKLLKALRWPAVAGVLAACAGQLLGARTPLAVAYIGLGVFAFGTNLLMIIRTLKGGWLRIGGYLAHLGLVVFIIGAIASTLYATPEQRILVPQGQSVNAYGYSFTFNGWRQDAAGRGVLELTAARDGRVAQLAPQLYLNEKMGGTMATPAISSELFQDLYVAPQEYQPPFDRNIADLTVGQATEVGPYKIVFNGFDVPDMTQAMEEAKIGASLSVTYEGQTTEIKPAILWLADETDPEAALRDMPVTLPGGHIASLAGFNPEQRRVVVRVAGLNLPIDPAKAVVVVSVKPGVILVWVGVVVTVIGGLLAAVRRRVEGETRLSGARQLPRGLALFGQLFGRPREPRP